MSETYSIVIKHDAFTFRAKHAVICQTESGVVMEPVHEHEFHFTVTITGPLDQNGWVVDFEQIIHCCTDLAVELEGKILIPGLNPGLQIHEENGTISTRFSDKIESFSASITKILPYSNTTTEFIACWMIRNLVKTLEKKKILAYPNNRYRFKITLEEAAGCFVEYCFENDD